MCARSTNSFSNIDKRIKQYGYDSQFESDVAAKMTEQQISWEREPTKVPWQPPPRKYIPDFSITNRSGKVWYLELKGLLTVDDRMKLIAVKQQNPELDLRLMFQYPRRKIRKGSKTTYADWAEKFGLPWCAGFIPSEWLLE